MSSSIRCFEGVRFGFDLGYSLSLAEKTKFRALIESQGGLVDLVFSEKSDCLVVTEDKLKGGQTYKVEKARKMKKPVVPVKYLIDCATSGRCVDAAVMELDGLVEGSSASFEALVASSTLAVEPSFVIAVHSIHNILAASEHVPQELVDKLKRPIWTPHLSSLFARFAPNPNVEADYGDDLDNYNGDGEFSIDRLRIEREMKLKADMEEKARQQAEKDREFAIKEEERRERERLAYEEEQRFIEQKNRRAAALAAQAARAAAAAARAAKAAKPQEEKPKPKVEKPKKPAVSTSSDGWITTNKANVKASASKPIAAPAPSVWKAPKAVFKAPNDVGLKIFVGGVSFEDIDAKAAAEKWNEERITKVKESRAEEIKKIVAGFGKIKLWTEAWKEGYAFATFAKKEDAERALRTLSDFNNRKALCKQVKARLVASLGEKLITPLPTFYVRWPTFYKKIVDRNAEKKAAERMEKQRVKEAQDQADKAERLAAANAAASTA